MPLTKQLSSVQNPGWLMMSWGIIHDSTTQTGNYNNPRTCDQPMAFPGWPWPFECHPRAEVCTASSAVRDKGGRGSPRANSGPGRNWLQNLKVISGYQTLSVE